MSEKIHQSRETGPNYIRTPRTVAQYRTVLLKKAKALVASASSIEKLDLRATIDGQDISMEFRVRPNGKGVVYTRGHYIQVESEWAEGETYPSYVSDETFGVEKKTYKGDLCQFKTLVRVGPMESPAEVSAKKKQVEDLFTK